jgi:acetoin utilization deacetylase AcuC-like enzyme
MRGPVQAVFSSLSLLFHPSRCRLVSTTRLLSSKTSNNDEAISNAPSSRGSSSTSGGIEEGAPYSSASSVSAALQPKSLATSRLGLDPTTNRFHAPIVYHEHYSFADWPPNHTFPMDKFERIAHALQTTTSKTIPTSLLPRPIIRQEMDFFRPLESCDIPRDWFQEIISPDFVHRFFTRQLTVEEARYIGFREQTHRVELVERTVLEVAGTVLTAQLAYHYGIASNVAGGTHHAHPMGGAGYTILNDLAVTANFLTDETLNQGSVIGIRKVLVIDCDVHQGDGTAKFQLFDDEGKKRLYTLSLHCASNYPRLKAHSTYDIGLPDGCGDDDYMAALEDSVNRALAEVGPDFVLYDAGVDVYEHDTLGRLCITEQGIRRRDRWVLDKCVTLGIPVAAVVGGGYDKDVNALARRHAIVHEECAYVWRKHQLWKKGKKQ